MLNEILNHDEKNRICPVHFNAMKYFGDIFNRKKQKSKHKYIFPMRKAGFTLKEAISFNFKVERKMWLRCLNQKERNKGGRPSLNNFMILSINKHLQENSSIAANRYLKLAQTNVMYRHSTIVEAFRTFKLKNFVSLNSFKKYFHPKFKKPHRVYNLKITVKRNFFEQYFFCSFRNIIVVFSLA